MKPDEVENLIQKYGLTESWADDLDALRLNMSIGGHVGNVPYASAEHYASILLDAQNQRAWVDRFTNLPFDVATKMNDGTLPLPSDEDFRQVFNVKLARLLIELGNDPEPIGPFSRKVCETLIIVALEERECAARRGER